MAHLVHCPAWGVWWRWAADSSRTQACSPLAKRTHQSRDKRSVRAQCPLTLPCGLRTSRKLSTIRPTLMA